MSNRKLVSVQEITNIEPIEGADRIEVARILGWRVVVGKDMHLKPGNPARRTSPPCGIRHLLAEHRIPEA